MFQGLNQFPRGRVKNLNGVLHNLEYVPQRAWILLLFEGRVDREEIAEHEELAVKVFAACCFVAVVLLF